METMIGSSVCRMLLRRCVKRVSTSCGEREERVGGDLADDEPEEDEDD